MSLFAKIQQANIQTEEKDVLGGALPTNVYDGGIKIAYLDAAKSGAINFTLEAVLLVNGAERSFRETFYISNKDGGFTYKNREGKDEPLPGYTIVDSICKAACGKALNELVPEVKMVRVKHDAEPEQREVFMELLGKRLKLGIANEVVDRTAKNDSTGKYEPTGETREQNTINKVFDEEGFTTLERETNKETPEFMNAWIKKNAGRVFNKAKGKANGSGAVAGKPGQPANKDLNLFG